MPIYTCCNCNKEFNRKSNFDYHMKDKKRPCVPKKILNVSVKPDIINTEKIDNILLKKNMSTNICMYCETTFTRNTSLQRHLKDICKSKKYIDELENLKERLNLVVTENKILKKENKVLKNKPNIKITNNILNNGIINNLNVKLVQFGNENIDNLNMEEVLNIYLKSTGSNILSNILKHVNLNDKYPENNNICITDLSRELVKIFNGKKFITKKFKNAKYDILCKVINNTYKIVDKFEITSKNIKSKLKINDISLKLIDGYSAEDIVRDEIKENKKLITNGDKFEQDEEDDEEIKFNLDEQFRIEYLKGKQIKLQEITMEKIKEELYNGRLKN